MNTVSRITRSLGAYVMALLQNAVLLTLLYMVGFAMAGVPWWFAVGLLCGALNLLPHLGPVLALGAALLVQFLATEDFVRLATVGGVWLAVQMIDGFLLSPRAAGKAGVNPISSIFLVLIGGLVFGPIGMLLAVPVTAVLLIVFRALRSR